MRVRITCISYIDLDPEDFREINDEGKTGPIPTLKEITEILKNPENVETLGEYLNDSLVFDYQITLDEV